MPNTAFAREPEERVAANVTARIVPCDVDERVRAGRIQRPREQRAVICVIGTAVRDALQTRHALAIADVVDPADGLSGLLRTPLGCGRRWHHLHTAGVAGSSPAAPTNFKTSHAGHVRRSAAAVSFLQDRRTVQRIRSPSVHLESLALRFTASLTADPPRCHTRRRIAGPEVNDASRDAYRLTPMPYERRFFFRNASILVQESA